MTSLEHSFIALERCCCGNKEAMAFLLLWRRYVHEIDDIIDGERPGAEALLATFALAAQLYSDPFYLKNLVALRQVVWTVTNGYADAVRWEGSEVPWQRDFADHYRHSGGEMVLAVAQLCGGYEHMRSISGELRSVSWSEHHTPAGKPV